MNVIGIFFSLLLGVVRDGIWWKKFLSCGQKRLEILNSNTQMRNKQKKFILVFIIWNLRPLHFQHSLNFFYFSSFLIWNMNHNSDETTIKWGKLRWKLFKSEKKFDIFYEVLSDVLSKLSHSTSEIECKHLKEIKDKRRRNIWENFQISETGKK